MLVAVEKNIEGSVVVEWEIVMDKSSLKLAADAGIWPQKLPPSNSGSTSQKAALIRVYFLFVWCFWYSGNQLLKVCISIGSSKVYLELGTWLNCVIIFWVNTFEGSSNCFALPGGNKNDPEKRETTNQLSKSLRACFFV